MINQLQIVRVGAGETERWGWSQIKSMGASYTSNGHSRLFLFHLFILFFKINFAQEKCIVFLLHKEKL